MFKKILLLFFISLGGFGYSQSPDYQNIIAKVKNLNPEIDLANKILIISIWNSTDISSRDMNKEFLRTYKMYQYARLSGGLKGVVFISISNDTDELNFQIASKKDLQDYHNVYCDFLGYNKSGILNNLNINTNYKNLVFNSSGELIFSNMQTDSIFITFNKLTTR